MRLDHRIRIDAPVARACDVLADVARWPEFMSALGEARVLGRDGGALRVELRESSGRVRDASVYRVTFPAPGVMRAVLERGLFRSGEVVWTLSPDGGGTRVTVAHRYEPDRPAGVPLPIRWFLPWWVGRIVRKSLVNFKVLVETGLSPKQKGRGTSKEGRGTGDGGRGEDLKAILSPVPRPSSLVPHPAPRPASPVPFEESHMIHTSNAVIVRAPAGEVYAVAEDKGAFPSFIPHVLESEEVREGDRVRFRMAARMKYGFVSRWVSERVAAAPDAFAEYRTTGFCRRMGGRWTVEAMPPDADGGPRTRLTLTHEFEVGHPVLGLFLPVDRLVKACVEDNSQKMLEAIRDRVESLRAARPVEEAVHV
jgi:ribosome-associated toxin RatA of RatAB toxin-antitoxin module